ncbi:MAG: 2,3-bisphosphoglycerate-independent phosphoglycerate mutase [Alphaproteobacteria bacterium]
MTDARKSPAVRPVVLCVLDGFGHRDETRDNAIALAKAPVLHRMMSNAPHALIATSGLAVGLPAGQMGNSEVGHMNIGAGRVVMQDLPRIDAAIADGSFKSIPALKELIAKLKASGGTCHLLGLVSPGGVHSHQNHIAALARALDEAGIPVAVHGFLDGRDTPPQSALEYIAKLESDLRGTKNVRFATISGRYYAMDRDKRWDRVEKAYRAIAEGNGIAAPNAKAAIDTSYAENKTDEFVLPRVIAGYAGMKDGDGILCANFRADRVREILTALVMPDFKEFAHPRAIKFAAKAGLTEYSEELAKQLQTLFPPDSLKDTLGEWVAAKGLKQLRLAETEKYAHVTFFLNGGRETEFPGEQRILIPSPKVATYDLQPEMSANEVTKQLCEAIKSKRFDLIVVNFANPDMVGHTGIMPAALKAIETIDHSLGEVEAALKSVDGVMVVTADHGNIEMMRDPETGAPHTAHTTFDVPIFLVNSQALGSPVQLNNGRLADIAPTVLALMGQPQPPEMTGHSLLSASSSSKGPAHAERQPA